MQAYGGVGETFFWFLFLILKMRMSG